jgi:hypothetical protein
LGGWLKWPRFFFVRFGGVLRNRSAVFVLLLLLCVCYRGYSQPAKKVVRLFTDDSPVPIDSIKIYSFETYPTKYTVSKYDYLTPIDSQSLMAIFYSEHRVCIALSEKEIGCLDTLVIFTSGIPQPCKRKSSFQGYYYPCADHGKVLGFYGDYQFPCGCDKKEFLKRKK